MNIEELIQKASKRKIILIISIITITAIIIYIITTNNLEEEILIGEFNENNSALNNIEEININENSISANSTDENNISINNTNENNISTNDINENKQNNVQEKNKIIVHVAGAVQKSGIVEIEEGQRIIDAIEKAGGATAQADLSKINLAYVLSDGQKVYIPKINENYTGEYVTGASSNEAKNNTSTSSTGNSTNKNEINKIININTASAEELQNLQGIGESIAKRIVEYRKENGKFNTIEDIKNVSGIGEAKYNKIKNNICVKWENNKKVTEK